MIKKEPNLRHQFEESLINLYDAKKLSDEPVAYLMFKLRWPAVYQWVEGKLEELENPIATGASLQKILDAYDDSWENQGFYQFIE